MNQYQEFEELIKCLAEESKIQNFNNWLMFSEYMRKGWPEKFFPRFINELESHPVEDELRIEEEETCILDEFFNSNEVSGDKLFHELLIECEHCWIKEQFLDSGKISHYHEQMLLASKPEAFFEDLKNISLSGDCQDSFEDMPDLSLLSKQTMLLVDCLYKNLEIIQASLNEYHVSSSKFVKFKYLKKLDFKSVISAANVLATDEVFGLDKLVVEKTRERLQQIFKVKHSRSGSDCDNSMDSSGAS